MFTTESHCARDGGGLLKALPKTGCPLGRSATYYVRYRKAASSRGSTLPLPRSSVSCCSRAALVAACLLGGSGCDILDPGRPYDLPEEDPSTAPQALRLGDFVYPCNQWKDGDRPPADHLLVDVFFHLPFGDPEVDRPSLYHRGVVERFGGMILRSYHLAGMRVWLPTDAIPEFPAIVMTVPEPRRYDTTVHIDFRMGLDWMADRLRIVELGGRVLIPPSSLPGFPPSAFVILPNRALPELRARPSVIGVRYSGIPKC